jgi:methionine-rich copper-binding protein CopC
MKKLLLALLPITLLSITSGYAAHFANAQLVQSTPAEGSVSHAAPGAFVLEFSEAVTLHEAYIKKDNDKPQALHNVPQNNAKTITIPAPSLTAGQYVLEWSAFTHESRVISGGIRFTVSADSVAAAPSSQ